MTAHLFNAWGKKIAEQQIRTTFDALALTAIYGNWQYAIVVASNGRPCEMFTRL